MTLPLPVWCFLDGPLQGTTRTAFGRLVDCLVPIINGRRRLVRFTYLPQDWFKDEKDRFIILAKILPQQHRKWARIKRASKDRQWH